MVVFSRLRDAAIIATFFSSLCAVADPNPDANPTHYPGHVEERDWIEANAMGGAQGILKEKRASTRYVNIAANTGGLGPATGQVPFRQDFVTFAQDATKLNLYLVALYRMQQNPQTSGTSFYQVAGVHGRPYKAWDGVTGSGGNTNSGYCTHSDVLFPTWHRPYLALYEQTLYNYVQQIANEFPAGSKYRTAAPGWRMPYWDWAVSATIPDLVGKQTTVTIVQASGSSTISNPLYSYKFNPLNTNDLPDYPYVYLGSTVRNPDSAWNSQPDDLNAQLANIGTNLRTRVYTLLTAYTNYMSFSNKGTSTSVNGQFDSLESVHDTIHGTIGGNGGHMGAVDYAAFDPIFWLHHCNIDRLFAIWQAINPNSGISAVTNQRATFAMAAGITETGNTPLTPFHLNDNTYYTSNMVMNVKSFGYTYPELQDWTNGGTMSSSQLRSSVIQIVNSLYGASQPGNILSSASAIASATPTLTATVAPVPIATKQAQTTPAAQQQVTKAASTLTTSKKAFTTSTAAAAQGTDWWNWNSFDWMWFNSQHAKRDLPFATSAGAGGAAGTSSGVFPTASSQSGTVDAVPAPVAVAPSIPKLVQKKTYQEYLVDVSVNNAALNGTFTIFVFLGNYTQDPSQWALDKNLVGTHSVFAAANGGHSMIVAGSIPLTASLINKVVSGSLPSLNTTSVVPYLAQNLHWGVRGSDAKTVYSGDVSSLQFQVVSSTVQLPDSSSDLPVWGPFITQYNVTQNKPAGITQGQTLGNGQ